MIAAVKVGRLKRETKGTGADCVRGSADHGGLPSIGTDSRVHELPPARICRPVRVRDE